MKKSIILSVLAAALVSCGGNKAKAPVEAIEDEVKEEAKEASLDGKWRLVDYAGETEVAVVPDAEQYCLQMQADGVFTINTDCNSIGGNYKLNGDSITFDNIGVTEMACPSEAVENAMKRILPQVTTYTIAADTVLTLRADARIMATFNRIK